MLRIHIYPTDEKILRAPCRDVFPSDLSYIDGIAPKMYQLGRHLNAAAIAAPQVGVPMRFFVTCGLQPEVVLNPSFGPLDYASPVDGPEGCLSFPGKILNKKRWSSIQGRGYTLDFKEISRHLHDFKARMWQHETEHTLGILFIDGEFQNDIDS